MSFAFIVMTVLLGSSVAIAFILQPSKEEPVNSPNNHRCQVESLQSIRKVLLRALNLQVEPQLPASGLDRFRERWSGNFTDADRKAKDAAGDLGEYCWSTELKCTIGESFHLAYVVLPVDISSVRHEMLEVRTTATTLHAHTSPTTITESCGLRYDVTQHFSSTVEAGTSFCIQVVTEEHVLGDNVLKCPPFLVTFWQRSTKQSNQGGGG
ncbi:hypothetical protein GBF38_010000 [Nibea albiflora]|uniref:Uncharacterized protein n=1 Tax=Nibea albiflora TaxID=240163 RepID=A0ACB7F8I4_NIBAL|nr:hypothetical protein GBF38_010000 [Nibea albiflora]